MTARPDGAVQAVRALFAAQRAALRAGQFSDPALVSERVMAAISALDPVRDRAALAALKDEARHTANLLRAARDGVARARGEMRSAQSTVLTTYDAYGQRKGPSAGGGRTLARG
ncbi:hypothetical protein roselon_01310 [Roseibacterium elongatum DSM 19469]|uniref:Flagellar protein FlgN n=1 Tax=Roseicyclus elongatus DSM 19469 TaxID=1294273 RepID=W8RRJ0_9RHOB|nr:hypothetical protein [Roseibacterium elongatum]AHM03698.1 hypothetical protein roselon_01310 [Roseibacterium elongatum DSM 19469]